MNSDRSASSDSDDGTAERPGGAWPAALRFLRAPKDPAESALRAIVVVGVVLGLVFTLWPSLDLRVSALFYDEAQRAWPWTHDATLVDLRALNHFIMRAIIAAAIIALVFLAAGERSFTFLPPRISAFLLATVVVAPGLITNGLLKAHWGRPRPGHVNDFNGELEFVPWWSPFGQCASNCSFVSGEASGAFVLLAVAVLVPERYRMVAIAAAIVWGLAVGMMRVAMGGHFLSDVLFAGVFTALAIWLLHGLFFRWR